MSEPSLPLQGIRVLETGRTLAARLAGVLLSDQGAEVFALDRDHAAEEGIEDYLNRGKHLLPAAAFSAVENADITVHDGHACEARPPWQISLGFTAGVPGDPDCDLPDDASDDLLNGMVGLYTDLGVTSRLLGREVIYTPLPLCSVYAAVLGAAAVSAALTDRQRTGAGRSIVIPRLAAGLSAIGVLAMDLKGIESHLLPPGLLTLAPELAAEVPKARASEAHMVWLVNRLNPTGGCYRSSDNRFLMTVSTVNRRLAIKMLEVLGLWQQVQALGVVDASPYDPASRAVADRNIALAQGMRSDLNIQIAGWIEEAFAARTAAEWEERFAKEQVPCGIVQDFSEWMNCSWARESGLVETVHGLQRAQLGRAVCMQSAKPYPPLSAGWNAAAVTNAAPPALRGSGTRSTKPLSGYVVLDLANVIAGPACGRLLGELGATVFKMDTTRPDHQPLRTFGQQRAKGYSSGSLPKPTSS